MNFRIFVLLITILCKYNPNILIDSAPNHWPTSTTNSPLTIRSANQRFLRQIIDPTTVQTIATTVQTTAATVPKTATNQITVTNVAKATTKCDGELKYLTRTCEGTLLPNDTCIGKTINQTECVPTTKKALTPNVTVIVTNVTVPIENLTTIECEGTLRTGLICDHEDKNCKNWTVCNPLTNLTTNLTANVTVPLTNLTTNITLNVTVPIIVPTTILTTILTTAPTTAPTITTTTTTEEDTYEPATTVTRLTTTTRRPTLRTEASTVATTTEKDTNWIVFVVMGGFGIFIIIICACGFVVLFFMLNMDYGFQADKKHKKVSPKKHGHHDRSPAHKKHTKDNRGTTKADFEDDRRTRATGTTRHTGHHTTHQKKDTKRKNR